MKSQSRKFAVLPLVAAMAIALSGCGGSSSSSSGSVTLSGTAVDGYLVGSEVCVDDNADGVVDAGETCTASATDATGDFSVTATATAPVIIRGGSDATTGLVFEGELTAPAGSTMITPLTTVMQALMLSESDPKSEADALAAVQAMFNLGATDITAVDPMSDVNLYARSVIAHTVMERISESVAAYTGGDKSAVYALAAGRLAALAAAGTNLIDSAGALDVTVSAQIVDTAMLAALGVSAADTAGLVTVLGAATSDLDDVFTVMNNYADVDSMTSTAAVTALNNVLTNRSVANILASVKANPTTVTLDNVVADVANLKKVVDGTATSADTVGGVVVSKYSDYLKVASLLVDGIGYDIVTFEGDGIPVSNSATTLGLTVTGEGTPLGATGSAQVSMGAKISAGDTADSRELIVIVDKVDLEWASDVLSVSVPSTATMTVSGTDSAGTNLVAELSNASGAVTSTVSSNSSGAISYDVSALLDEVAGNLSGQNSIFDGLDLMVGDFHVEMVVSGIEVRQGSSDELGTPLTITVGDTSVVGNGVEGTVIVTTRTPPTVVNNTMTATEGVEATITTADLLGDDTAAGYGVISVSAVDAATSNSDAITNSSGTLTFTPTAAGTHTFSYTVSEVDGTSATGTVTVTVSEAAYYDNSDNLARGNAGGTVTASASVVSGSTSATYQLFMNATAHPGEETGTPPTALVLYFDDGSVTVSASVHPDYSGVDGTLIKTDGVVVTASSEFTLTSDTTQDITATY
jgi:hypothetical protein